MASPHPALEHLNSGLCVQVLQKVQQAFLAHVKTTYPTDEDRRFLYAITDDDAVDKDIRVKQEFYEAVRPALHYLTPPAVHDLMQREVRASFVETDEKAISLAYQAYRWLDYWENICYRRLLRTGILKLSYSELERQASSFYLYLKFKLENPGKYEEYDENLRKINEHINQIYSKISEIGSIQAHADYIAPLAEKGL